MANKFELPKLEYKYNYLEPFIDAKTMEIHHSKHHQAYTDKFNSALGKYPKFFKKSAEEIIKNLNEIPEDIRLAVRNNGGGYVNHKFLWTIFREGRENNFPKQVNISSAIDGQFGSFEKFKEEFTNKALSLFGSGWTWLVLNENKDLEILNTANQDSPLSEWKAPLLTIDLWEHAYYLKYQNKRAEYIENFFKLIDWEKVEYYLKNSMKIKGGKKNKG